MQGSTDQNILKAFPKDNPEGKNKTRMILASFAIVVLGLVTGYFISGTSSGGAGGLSNEVGTANVTVTENEAGLGDDSAFPDSAEGILVEGGIQGEGTHHLERPGGASQNVYLTSTVINLQSFVGKKVKVHGETLSAIKAGWLMDVGKVKVVN